MADGWGRPAGTCRSQLVDIGVSWLQILWIDVSMNRLDFVDQGAQIREWSQRILDDPEIN